MKEKTSITLSREVLAQSIIWREEVLSIRSIERVLRKYFRDRQRAALHARDLERINRAADELNAEALDVLQYQAPIDWSAD